MIAIDICETDAGKPTLAMSQTCAPWNLNPLKRNETYVFLSTKSQYPVNVETKNIDRIVA